MRIFNQKMAVLLALCTLLVTSCSSKPNPPPSDLDFLKYGMSVDEVIAQLGPPDKDIGSGVPALLFTLEDGSYLVLEFLRGELVMASHRYPNSDGTSYEYEKYDLE